MLILNCVGKVLVKHSQTLYIGKVTKLQERKKTVKSYFTIPRL